MLTIEYRVTYGNGRVLREAATEVVTVRARDINSGYPKVLKIARQPLGNGTVREIVSLTFWQVH